MRPKQTDFETFKRLIVQCLENNQAVYSNLKKADLDKGLLERQDVELILTIMDRADAIRLYSHGKSSPV